MSLGLSHLCFFPSVLCTEVTDKIFAELRNGCKLAEAEGRSFLRPDFLRCVL